MKVQATKSKNGKKAVSSRKPAPRLTRSLVRLAGFCRHCWRTISALARDLSYSQMSTAEELQEELEKAKEPFDKKVAATMAILAAFLAVVSVLGHIMTTEELLVQQKASDQWSYYQAKSIRRYQSEVARDLFSGMKLERSERAIPEELREVQEGRRRHSERGAGLGAGEPSARPASARVPFR